MQQQINKLIGKFRDKFGDPKIAAMRVVKSGIFLSWLFFFIVLTALYVWYMPPGDRASFAHQDMAMNNKNQQKTQKKLDKDGKEKPAPVSHLKGDKSKDNKLKDKRGGDGVQAKAEKQSKQPQEKSENQDKKPIVRRSAISMKIRQPEVFKPSIILPRPHFDKNSVRKMAIIVTGFGLLQEQDKQILSKLPNKVAVAYSANAHRLLEQCRECYNLKKREILLSLPLEPMQYPDIDPGKLTLLTGVPVEQNLSILKKLLHYNPFISGVIGNYGSHFLAIVDDLAPVIEDLARRELFFLDPQTCMQSQTLDICQQLNARCGRIDIALPSPALPKELDKIFDSAMELAKETGWALCVIPATKLTAEKLPEWMREMRKRKIALISVKKLLKGIEELMDKKPVNGGNDEVKSSKTKVKKEKA